MSKVIVRKKSEQLYRLFAVCPGGLDEILKAEIEALPAKILASYPGGVEFEGNLDTAYLANLKLRTASRVLLLLQDFKKIFKPEELYAAVREIDWARVFHPQCTFAIYVTASQTKERRIPVNPQFWALKAKDAIVDQFRNRFDARPDIDREDPDITIRMHLHDQKLKVYLDLSGPSLHERGYRREVGEAPMKENLAAGLLLLAGWDKLARQGYAFLDPFCGSGTLLIEAALIATRTAPGLFRSRFGFMSWKDHQGARFEQVREKVKSEILPLTAEQLHIEGSDQNQEIVRIARDNIERAQFSSLIRVNVADVGHARPIAPKGLLVSNPPYGIRLDEVENLRKTYEVLGSTLKHQFKNWSAGIITSEKSLLHAISLKPSKKFSLHNGGLESQFSIFKLY